MADINNTANDTLLSGTSGDDSIQNGGYWYEDSNYIWHDGGSYVTMDAGDGDDYIRNYQGDKVLIAGGNGNDSISNSGSNVTMDAGAGDDSISNGGSNVSIKRARAMIPFITAVRVLWLTALREMTAFRTAARK